MVLHFLRLHMQMLMLMIACLTCRNGYICILQLALLSFPFRAMHAYLNPKKMKPPLTNGRRSIVIGIIVVFWKQGSVSSSG